MILVAKPDVESIVNSSKPRGKKYLYAALAAVVLALLIVWLIQRGSQVDPAQQFVFDDVRQQDILVTVTATGSVEPTNKFEISSELSGTVRSISVDVNEQVERGQVLATLDTAKLDAALQHSKATLASRHARVAEAEATLEELRQGYDRSLTLYEQQLVSRESYLAAKAALERARASLSSVKADVQVAEADVAVDQTNLEKACICSPASGIVLERNVEVGQIVASSFQAPVLFTLAEDLSQMELQVDVDEADIAKVSVGDAASFTVEAWQGRQFPAQISELRYMPQTINGVVTYKAILSIDNSEQLLRPGMTATAVITVEQINNALVVSNAAFRYLPPVSAEPDEEGGSGLVGMLFSRPPSAAAITSNELNADGKATLYTLRENEVTALEVLTGATDGQVTQIRQGALEAGDRVITSAAPER